MLAALRTLLTWFKSPPKATEKTALEQKPSIPELLLAHHEDAYQPSYLIPYDENLLERARTQWQLGDWQNLSRLNIDALQHHPERAKIALFAAAGRLQTGMDSEARQYIRLAQDWGVSGKLINQVLVAGVPNSSEKRVAILVQQGRAIEQITESSKLGSSTSDIQLVSQAPITSQLEQISTPQNEISALKATHYDQILTFKSNYSNRVKEYQQSCRFSRVAVTGDLLRPSWDGKMCQGHNIKWLHSFLVTQIACAFSADAKGTSFVRCVQGDIAITKATYLAAGLPFTEDGWAALYFRSSTDDLNRLIGENYKIQENELVVAFEIPKIVKNYFDTTGVTYIDIRIGQYRFFDDIPLAFSTNDPNIETILRKHQLTDSTIRWFTQFEKMCRSSAAVTIESDALVFFGQTSKDASLIVNGVFDSFKNYSEKILQTANLYSHRYYKHHPYETSMEAEDFFKSAGFVIISDNTYDLLCSERLSCAAALTSSVLHEANLFSKQIIRLGQSDIYGGNTLIYDAFLSSEFWAKIIGIDKPQILFSAPSKPNLIRSTIGASWGK